MRLHRLLLLSCGLLLSACDRGQVIPTVANPDALATAIVETRNAPPPGFGTVSFEQIDANLRTVSGWRAALELNFTGSFTGTNREANAEIAIETSYDYLGTAWRTLVDTSGSMFGDEGTLSYEVVNLGQTAYLVSDSTCMTEGARSAAALRVGELVGGVAQAQHRGTQPETINGARAWEYVFTPDALRLPDPILSGGGQVTSVTGEVWVNPEHNIVVRYYATIVLENAVIFQRPDNPLPPVSGVLRIYYDVSEIGVIPNISIPNGC